jgi:hypothetical protein
LLGRSQIERAEWAGRFLVAQQQSRANGQEGDPRFVPHSRLDWSVEGRVYIDT